MKWRIPEKSRPYALSDCNRYAINWNEPKTQYMAIRLGTPDKGAWIGSVSLCVGTRGECLRACEGDAGEISERL